MRLAACVAVLSAAPAMAQEADLPSRPGAGVEAFASTDSDKTDIFKLEARGFVDYRDPERYRGVAFEQAWFKPLGQTTITARRAYLLAADHAGDWRWNARVGSDGHTVLGGAELRSADWRQDYFIERDLVESKQGIEKRLYSTFLGASFDLPAGRRDSFTVMGGVQEFTGQNVRLHLRANAIHVLDEKAGLSVHLRGRYFHSTRPHEYDYYSPRDYVQVLPMLQLRRVHNDWEYRLQGAFGAQWATGEGWRDARYANLRIQSPHSGRGWDVHAELTYSNVANMTGVGYDYVSARLGVATAF